MSSSWKAQPGVLSGARASGQPIRWPLPPALEHSPKVAYRNDHAKGLARCNAPEIAGNYVYLTLPDMRRLVALAHRHVLSEPLYGAGIELGAGCGLLSSVVAEDPAVRQVLALEVCEQAAGLIIPQVAEWVLGSYAQKVVPVVGSFDDLQLPDGTLDFVVEIDALHHSDDLTATLRECARVLKPGGRILCFDRCHPDAVTDREVDEMLSVVYSREFLIANHYPPGAVLTRRDNGEHEYRLYEWKAAFQAAGLRLTAMASFESAISPRAALKGMLSLLPRSVRRRLYRSDGPTPRSTLQWLIQQLRAATGYYRRRREVLAPKKTTVFALVKP
jgi:SAM-dependent methyltransferase